MLVVSVAHQANASFRSDKRKNGKPPRSTANWNEKARRNDATRKEAVSGGKKAMAVVSPRQGATGRVLPVRRRSTKAKRGKSTERRPVCAQRASAQTPLGTEAARGTRASGCPRGPQWEVHKLGGACVAGPEEIQPLLKLVEGHSGGVSGASAQMVVVSAMGGSPKVTDLLLRAVERAARRDDSHLLDLSAVREKYAAAAEALLGKKEEEDDEEGGGDRELGRFLSALDDECEGLKSMLRAMSLAGMSAPAFRDYVVGHGEIWSAMLVAAFLRRHGVRARWMDARKILSVRESADGTSVDVDWSISDANLDQWWSETFKGEAGPEVVVATGFIASDPEGRPTTLRRNGSDYSATALGYLLRCREITIWSDVDGVYSADPRRVPDAVPLRNLSYNEAWELSYFGADVLHPRTTVPAMRLGIPLTLRNYFRPEDPGTRISLDAEEPASNFSGSGIDSRPQRSDRPPLNEIVKGFSTIDDVTLVNLEGTGMVGVQGTAASIFGAVRDAGCNVIMISQASSEHSVSFAVKTAEADAAVSAVTAAFSEAIADGRISRVGRVDNCTVLAAVGQRMSATYGVCAMLFDALAKANVNVMAVAQGCSEYNVTTVISQEDSSRALSAVHSRFYLSETPLGVGVIGPGLIGSTLLQQFAEQSAYLHKEFNIDLRLLGVANTSRMATSQVGLPLDCWQNSLQEASEASEPTDLDRFTELMMESACPNKVIVDCTSSDAVANRYMDWIKQGIHVVTPNKKANSGPYDFYSQLREHQRKSYTHYFYEATVGAGLPVVSTLQQLKETGDRIKRVEGIVSGTLSYIFNVWDGTTPFSQVVADAKNAGFTEPDPRDDLNGMDVARKFVILARECGLRVDLSDLQVESLVPPELEDVSSVDEFMEKLPQYDDRLEARLQEARNEDAVLRFVGFVDVENNTAGVKLGKYGKSHPFSSLQGTDNILSFETRRYSPPAQPLVVRGPGAGAEVTAGGIFGDVLRLAAYLGAPS